MARREELCGDGDGVGGGGVVLVLVLGKGGGGNGVEYQVEMLREYICIEDRKPPPA